MGTKGHQKAHSKHFTVKVQRQLSSNPVTSGHPLCRNRQSEYFLQTKKKDMIPLFSQEQIWLSMILRLNKS